jgi:hypothetical protein
MKSQRSGPLAVVVDRLVERSMLLPSIYKYPPSSVSHMKQDRHPAIRATCYIRCRISRLQAGLSPRGTAAKDQEKRRPRLADSQGLSGWALDAGIPDSDFDLEGVGVCAAAGIADIAVAASIELGTSNMSRRLIAV